MKSLKQRSQYPIPEETLKEEMTAEKGRLLSF